MFHYGPALSFIRHSRPYCSFINFSITFYGYLGSTNYATINLFTKFIKILSVHVVANAYRGYDAVNTPQAPHVGQGRAAPRNLRSRPKDEKTWGGARGGTGQGRVRHSQLPRSSCDIPEVDENEPLLS